MSALRHRLVRRDLALIRPPLRGGSGFRPVGPQPDALQRPRSIIIRVAEPVAVAEAVGYGPVVVALHRPRSEEHPSELQSLMRISYAVFCLKKKKTVKLKIHYAIALKYQHTEYQLNTKKYRHH